MINTNNYQEELSRTARMSHGSLPYDIQLKSTTDFVQSILINMFSDDPYNWIICEGSSEKIYFEKYFEDEIKNLNLKIIPVGGAKKIKKIYQNIIIPYNEMKESLGKKTKIGKLLLLSDTDNKLVEYDVKRDEFIRCNRLVLNDDTVELVDIQAIPKEPATEIEDCLNSKLFMKTILSFENKYKKLLEKIPFPENIGEGISKFELNLGPKDIKNLNKFFDIEDGDMKILFAKRYVDFLSQDEYLVPNWILELKKWFKN